MSCSTEGTGVWQETATDRGEKFCLYAARNQMIAAYIAWLFP